jgi:hypothetical protein
MRLVPEKEVQRVVGRCGWGKVRGAKWLTVGN